MRSLAARFAATFAALALGGCGDGAPQTRAPAELKCDVSLLVLGVAQDAGKPQIGNPDDIAWARPGLARHATSLALIDRRGQAPRRWLFEATPDIKTQLNMMDRAAPGAAGPLGLEGVFLTHAHIGHYAGLMMLGHEAAGASQLIVYAMPLMADFLSGNGPWSQLVRYENIRLAIMADHEAEAVADDVTVTPFTVPHRQEFSEVVGFNIDGPHASALFIPDIDSWEDWDAAGGSIEDAIAGVDYAFIDATFFANGEIPGRDMSGFPHPFVTHSMERLQDLPDAEKSKVRFIHINHTNPLLTPSSREQRTVDMAGFAVAREGEEYCL
ncbi:MAG: hypothetical protein KDA46_01900 [Parvularculaceae bacterium]|nr:hypothetical protein [Parvularculaceae bacterium]